MNPLPRLAVALTLASGSLSTAGLCQVQSTWLRTHALPFATTKPGSTLDDLRGLMTLVGDVPVIGLGEATHGTREFFQMKHRIIEQIASQTSFILVAIEAGMPEAARLNSFILEGKGDPRELLADMHWWCWNTQEVLDLVYWMRRLNQSGTRHLEFAGFDMQDPRLALLHLEHFVHTVDPEFVDSLSRLRSRLYLAVPRMRNRQSPDSGLAALSDDWHALVAHLVSSRERYRRVASGDTVDWGIQNARVVSQAVDLAIKNRHPSGQVGLRFRDSCMAENAVWLIKRTPEQSRIILWAHNDHVSKRRGQMGAYLATRYASDYFAIAQTCGAGTYTAVHQKNGLGAYSIAVPAFGSLEANCASIHIPQFVLDLRQASSTDPASSWLTRPVLMRMIGPVAIDKQQSVANLYEEFDALIYFQETEASRCFGLTASN